MKNIRVLIYLMFVTSAGFAQINNHGLEYRFRPDSTRTGELYLNVFNFNYMRNYEFYNRFQDGYTLFGAQLEPQLVYYAHPKLLITAGVHLRKDFGNDGIYKTYPLFSVKYQNGHSTLINGVLEGNIHHRFIEPIFDFEKRITEPVEYGTQLLVNKQSFFLDAFINWKKMIYKPSGQQEQFFAGASADVSVLKSEKLDFSIPIQMLAFHQGGQIDTIADPLKTFVNTALGFKLTVPLGNFIKSFSTENYITGYRDFSNTKEQAFLKGSGIYLNAKATTSFGTIGATYWKGDAYISQGGMPIYQSVSQHINYPAYSEKDRKLLIIRYAHQKYLLPNLYMDFRFEPVIDLGATGSKKIEFFNSMFLVYKQEFRLLKK